MPIGIQKLELMSYFKLPSTLFGKSVQRSYSFYATFLDNPFNKGGNRKEIGPMPVIRPHHFLRVSMPTYSFTKEALIYGQVPVSFPVLNVDNAKELTVSVELEEDEFGTVEFFISWCQRSIIDKDGYYVAPLKNRIGHLVIEITDPNGLPILYYYYKDLFFLNVTDVSYSYDSNDSIKRNITFGVDRIETLFTKYSAINALQKVVFTGGF